MTNDNPHPTTLYQDTWHSHLPLDDFALKRVTVVPPLLAGAVCPAGQYTFAVSHDGGATWRNPTDDDTVTLLEAIYRTGQCCQGLEAGCWIQDQS